MQSEGQVGPFVLADGTVNTLRMGRQGEQIFSELHGRFYEQNFRGNVYSGGMASTAITNTTFTAQTLTATCTPIAGVWNPSTSPVNLEILQATLSCIISALQNTGGGPYVWASSVGNTAITLGNAPFSRKTGVASGSYAKDMSGVALTGQTNALVVRGAAALGGGSSLAAAFLATQAGAPGFQASSTEVFDGALIVPPGGILALLGSTTPVAVSASSMLLWIETPI